jgi:uncharacterized protein (TIGR00106 family)
MIIAELSIVPLGQTTSVSPFVNIALKTLRTIPNLVVTPNSMGTVLQAKDLDTILSAVHKAHDAVINAGAKRVITQLKIDDRRDKDATIETKLKSIA